ncbi:MAG: hypothetical protein ACI8W7_004936, partial [Gammaproteobacteria bacterium]
AGNEREPPQSVGIVRAVLRMRIRWPTVASVLTH